jgi:ABC-type branched-subunit amino acid transport system ATPase component
MELIAESISKAFAGVHALQDVSLRIAKGEIVGVIGPNGSGKTTLINVISGVESPTAGRIRLGDDSWNALASYRVARKGIGRTFQTIRVFTEMTVLENVEVAACAHEETKGSRRRREVSRKSLERFDLGRFADTLVRELPYGLQRRVEIARATVSRPHFILLDEPAAGLNETESDELLSVLLGLRDEFGLGILLVDHDLRLIMGCTDRICVLAQGSVLAEGTPDKVRHDPKVVRAYIGG